MNLIHTKKKPLFQKIEAAALKNPDTVQTLMNEVYLGLGDTSRLVLQNPLLNRSEFDIENPHLHVLRLMRNPDYFWFTCKWLFNIDLLPFQCVILKELWTRKFPMLVASRGGGKTWIMSLYCMLRALFSQGSKIVIVGSAFRQSKLLFEYMETFWRKAPIVRDIVGSGKGQGPKRDIDRCSFYVGTSVIHAIPLGDGTKIRGLRATHTIADEFASIPKEVFETVVGGFSSVNLDPVAAVKRRSQIDLLKLMNAWTPEMAENERIDNQGNQTVFSGTAYYSFNHFAEYWQKWCNIIRAGTNEDKLGEIFGGEIPSTFDTSHYSVVRIPFHKLPPGFMDEATVARAKATVHSSTYQMEYGACFCTDSDGFFKRSLIESCVCTNLEEPYTPFHFRAAVTGKPNSTYVYGVDPASERDNFAIVIIEVDKDSPHQHRVVYCWTMNRKIHKMRVKNRAVEENDFYSYCARKIRDLMRVFPTEHIGIDAQGGGRAVMERLQDPSATLDSAPRLLPYRKQKDDGFWWEKDNKPTDSEVGRKIIHAIEFAKADWTSEANHGLRKDLEEKVTVFPHFDAYSLEESIKLDATLYRDDDDYRMHDTLEDCMLDIEELKDELTTIQYSQTGTSGRDKFDTPETVEPGGKKGRLRKDRYSAFVIANMIARCMRFRPVKPTRQVVGAGAHKGMEHHNNDKGPAYYGNDALVSKMGPTLGMGIVR